MPEFRPFQGWRYNLAVVGDLDRVISPPYDVIDHATADRLLKASPYNVVRLELPTAVNADPQAPYQRAASLLRRWCAENVLIKEAEPAYYLLRQHFSLGQERLVRRGLFGIMRLVPFSQGVYPHENTMAGPKADRLALLEHLHANVSPVFAVYVDDSASLIEDIERTVCTQPPLRAEDINGVINELWPIYHQELIARIRADVSHRAVLLADGHHRYETALAYRDLVQQRSGQEWSPEHPANFILICLVPSGDPGLRILPTHRLLNLDCPLGVRDLPTLLPPLFDVELIGSGLNAAEQCWHQINSRGDSTSLGVGTADENSWAVVTPRDRDILRRTTPSRSDVWHTLAVNLAHQVLLPRLVPQDSVRNIRYEHDVGAVARALAHKQADLAILVPPPSVKDFVTVSLAGERLPAKSTYFFPKLPTGLVLYRHDA